MSEKLCVFCDHLSINIECERGYYEGDVYPHGFIRCLQGYWSLEPAEGVKGAFSRGSLAQAIQLAKTCEQYSPPGATIAWTQK